MSYKFGEIDASNNMPLVHKAVQGFHILDIIIFGISIASSLGIGIYYSMSGGKQKTTNEYLLADRKLKTIPAALSILVSGISAILVLGEPAEMYTHGSQLFLKTFGYSLICIISGFVFVPVFYGLKLKSSFEYFEMRFNSKLLRLMGTVPLVISGILYMGLVLYTPSIAMSAATGFPLLYSVLICAFISTLYTALGGMKAVIWTDVVQAVIMIGGLFVIAIYGLWNIGGFGNLYRISNEHGRINFFNFSPDPTERLTFWSLIIGGCISHMSAGISQVSIQRYCSLSSLKEARRCVWLNVPGLLTINGLACIVGLVIFVHYSMLDCDPLKAGFISSSNQILPYYIMDVLKFPGIQGIFLAVLFSGALSSISSHLNSSAVCTWEDILKKRFVKTSEQTKTVITKMLVVFYGFISLIVALLTNSIGYHVLQVSLMFGNALGGPVNGLFLLGIFCPYANATGAKAGFVVSMLTSLWIMFGAFLNKAHREQLPTSVGHCSIANSSVISMSSNMSFSTTPLVNIEHDNSLSGINQIYGLSFLWYSTLNILILLVTATIVSALTGFNKNNTIDEKLCSSLVKRWCKREISISEEGIKKQQKVDDVILIVLPHKD